MKPQACEGFESFLCDKSSLNAKDEQFLTAKRTLTIQKIVIGILQTTPLFVLIIIEILHNFKICSPLNKHGMTI